MSPALHSSLGIAAYLALFSFVAVAFLFINLVVGRLLRPANPHPEKLEIYECGEPTIGSGFVQFDLRFYVVALLFIIFDVEVAFFFPWATVFGKATNLMDPRFEVVTATSQGPALTPDARALYRELGVRRPEAAREVPLALRDRIRATDNPEVRATQVARQSARQLAQITLFDIGVFFFVLMVGFAYVWKRGDLDWVRALSRERAERPLRLAGVPAREPPLVSV